MNKLGRWGAIFGALVLLPVGFWGMSRSAEPGSPSPVVTESPSRPGDFADGACVSLAPEREPPRGVVFLDAGHGGLDPGAFGRTSDGRRVAEKTVALALVNETAKRLQAAGYRVVLSRAADTLVGVPYPNDVRDEILTGLGVHRDLLARIRCANRARADVLLSIHMNAFSDPDEGGTMTFYDPDRPFSSDNLHFARLVHARVLDAMKGAGLNVQDRRVISDTVSMGRQARTSQAKRYGHEPLLGPRMAGWVSNPSRMPGAILETVFLTRPVEADFVTSARGRELLAGALTGAIRDFLAQ